jgi:HTH-type transcriptional regulator, sugar sensing transcriptional regulator
MENSQFIETLTELGLSEHEAKVYFAALSIGPATILNIASAAETKRTTVYSVVESLQHKGLMRVELKGWKKLFVAEAPENLENILEARKDKLKKLLPEFSALYNLKGGESFIKYYEGLEGIKQIYEGLLRDIKPNDYYLIISHMTPWLDLDRTYFEDFIRRRSKKNLDIRALFQDSPIARKLQQQQTNFNEKIKILPNSTSLTTNLVVTPQRVVIHQLIPPVLAIVIENKSVIKMHKEMFEIMWRSLSDEKEPAKVGS